MSVSTTNLDWILHGIADVVACQVTCSEQSGWEVFVSDSLWAANGHRGLRGTTSSDGLTHADHGARAGTRGIVRFVVWREEGREAFGVLLKHGPEENMARLGVHRSVNIVKPNAACARRRRDESRRQGAEVHCLMVRVNVSSCSVGKNNLEDLRSMILYERQVENTPEVRRDLIVGTIEYTIFNEGCVTAPRGWPTNLLGGSLSTEVCVIASRGWQMNLLEAQRLLCSPE